MDYNDYLKIATDYSIKQWGFDIVRFAGEEEGWRYFSCTRDGRPHYSSLPMAIRVNKHGEIETLEGDLRLRVNFMAYQLESKSQY